MVSITFYGRNVKELDNQKLRYLKRIQVMKLFKQ